MQAVDGLKTSQDPGASKLIAKLAQAGILELVSGYGEGAGAVSTAPVPFEEGTPMMRPMFVEFPEDRACETLDKQYMLGDSLLVAPIFKESGEVEYYVPEGKWQKETYDYFHMPLLARPNTILAVGNNSERPDYDYAEGITLYLVNMEDGKATETAVTDLQGNTVLTVKARRNGKTVTVCAEGRTKHVTYKIMGNEELEVAVE